jgi:hypothetical protein
VARAVRPPTFTLRSREFVDLARLITDLLRSHGVRDREVMTELKRRIALVGLGEDVVPADSGAAARIAPASALTRRGHWLARTAQHAEVLEPAPPLVPVGPGHLVAEAER